MILKLQSYSQVDLVPVHGYFDLYEFEYEYYDNLKQILFEDLTDSPMIRYLVTPSFKPEYAFQIERGEKKNQYYIIYRCAKENIWYSENKSEVEVISKKRRISQKDVELITKLYSNVINRARFRKNHISGNDGTNYFFSVWEWETKSGQAWSPYKGSALFELVEISEKILLEATAVNFNTNLKKRIKKLSDKYALTDIPRTLKLKTFAMDTIISYLNENIAIDSEDLFRASNHFDFVYKFNSKGKLSSIKNQEESGANKIENLFYSFDTRKQRKKFKKILGNLDLSILDLENSLLLKIDLQYDEKKKILKKRVYKWDF